VQEEEAKSCLL